MLASFRLRFQCGFVVESAGHRGRHRRECRIPLAKPPPGSFLPSLPEPGTSQRFHLHFAFETNSALLFLCTNRLTMRNGLPCLTVQFLNLDLNPPSSDKVYRFPLPLLALLSQSIFRSPCFRQDQSKTSFRRVIEAKRSIFCLCSKGPELADWARSHPAPNRVRPALRF